MDGVAIPVSYPQIAGFCQKHHIHKLAFFGSVVRSDFTPQSDVDVLVAFDPDHVPGWDFFLMEAELAQLIGRPVDLLTYRSLGRSIRETVLSEAVVIYDEA